MLLIWNSVILFEHNKGQNKVGSKRVIISPISGSKTRENKCHEQSFTLNKWQSHLKPWGFDLDPLNASF